MARGFDNPPTTIREWIDWEREHMKSDESPDDFKEGYDEALCNLELFLHLDFAKPDSSTNGWATRKESPPVGQDYR